MTQWMRVYHNSSVHFARRLSSTISFSGVTRSLTEESFIWPSIVEVKNAQQENCEKSPTTTINQDCLIISKNGISWIPSSWKDLKLRLLTIAHTGKGGHRAMRHGTPSERRSIGLGSETKYVHLFRLTCFVVYLNAEKKYYDHLPRPSTLNYQMRLFTSIIF